MPDNTPWNGEKTWIAIGTGVGVVALSCLLASMVRSSCCMRGFPQMRCCDFFLGILVVLIYLALGMSIIAACYHTDHGYTWILPAFNIALALAFSSGFSKASGYGMVINLTLFFVGVATLLQYIWKNHSAWGAGLEAPYVVLMALMTLAAWINCSSRRVSEGSTCNK